TENADNPDGNIYTLLELPKYIGTGNYHNYGIAITGPADPDKETRPVRIDTNLNYEWPQISGTKDAPEPMPLILTITVSGLTPGTTYNLYKYCDENDVPVRNFNADAKAKNNPPWQVIKNPPGSTWGTSHPIQSNEKFFLRCVPA
ncbi:MAG TPA: hypothetical protein VFU15_02940, partial [Bacteroidia bacterium]|nr:hypothetical protein [Bacteroidia bacterium]